jgi:DNA polymerase-4
MSLNALYVDFNSHFASVEQLLQPSLRGKPIGVLPVMAETTCCIAASYEAKAFGIKTGTGVRDARKLCKDVIFVEARPPLYVEHHHKLIAIVASCTHV